MTKRHERGDEETAAVASRIESVLFLHGEPMKEETLAKLLGESGESVGAALGFLEERHDADGSGLALLRHDGAAALSTAPKNAGTVATFLSTEREESLGKATLETLAVVAYRAPVTRGDIDAIRGVNSSSALRNLLLRGLVDREPNPLDNREFRYAPSFRLLELLGISSLAELPDFATLSADARLSAAIETTDEEGDPVSRGTDASGIDHPDISVGSEGIEGEGSDT